MLEYEWGNPSTMMLSGDEASHQEADHHRQIYDHYSTAAPQPFNDNLNLLPHPNSTAAAAAALFHHQTPTHHHPTHNPFYDLRSYAASSPYAATPHPSLLSLDPTPSPAAAGAGAGGGSAHSYFLVPKTEEVSRASDFTARIGLNLGGRTYFSSADDDFVNRLYRRSRPFDAGTTNAPRCQAEGCNADLTHAKHYHRRHKVCEFHSKASTVIAAGLTQRFCQQCSRFHLLSEFDNGKRSCRRRLADHNRRRRKSSQTNQENPKSSLPENTCNSSSDQNLARSPPDSGAPSSSSVTVAISPPRMSLDCFKQRSSPYHSTAAASSASSSSLFFSSG